MVNYPHKNVHGWSYFESRPQRSKQTAYKRNYILINSAYLYVHFDLVNLRKNWIKLIKILIMLLSDVLFYPKNLTICTIFVNFSGPFDRTKVTSITACTDKIALRPSFQIRLCFSSVERSLWCKDTLPRSERGPQCNFVGGCHKRGSRRRRSKGEVRCRWLQPVEGLPPLWRHQYGFYYSTGRICCTLATRWSWRQTLVKVWKNMRLN